MLKAILFACVLAAAGFGCRNADRNATESSPTRPVESYSTGAEATSRDIESAATIRTGEGSRAEARPGARKTRSSGANTGVGTREDEADTEIDDDADTSSIPTAGGTDGILSTNGGKIVTGSATLELDMPSADAGADAPTQ